MFISFSGVLHILYVAEPAPAAQNECNSVLSYFRVVEPFPASPISKAILALQCRYLSLRYPCEGADTVSLQPGPETPTYVLQRRGHQLDGFGILQKGTV